MMQVQDPGSAGFLDIKMIEIPPIVFFMVVYEVLDIGACSIGIEYAGNHTGRFVGNWDG
jgi:hypothetical protein